MSKNDFCINIKMWNEKDKKKNPKNKNGDWMINNINIFDINNINKTDILIKQDENNNKYCFIIIDMETCNGISRKNNSIIQLSFMFLGTNYIYDTYTRPDDSIPWMIENKYFSSNITKNTIKDSPFLEYILLSFLKIISIFNDIEPIFIAHNASFNKEILEMCFNFYNIKFRYNKWCNTMNKNFFNIRNNNGKLIKSLKNISQTLLNEKGNNNIILHNSKNDLYILYRCLLKIYICDDNLSSIIFKTININEKDKNNNNSNEDKINISNLLDKYYDIINKEEEILKDKNIIENEFKKFLKNDDYIIINNKKIIFKEITIKDFFEENIKKEKYKKLHIINI
jgi:DNA polymerase III epsilon subunit-like protein